jgi:GNAT superfamily N-acetyltransferase
VVTHLVIRYPSPADAGAIVRLVRQLGYPADDGRVRQILDMLLDDPRYVVVIAEDAEGDVVGLLSLSSRPVLRLQGWIGTVEELVVESGARGRGIGDRLLQHAKGLAFEHGWIRLEAGVTRSREANRRQFFFSRGFVEAESVTYRWGLLEGKNPPLPALGARPRRHELV